MENKCDLTDIVDNIEFIGRQKNDNAYFYKGYLKNSDVRVFIKVLVFSEKIPEMFDVSEYERCVYDNIINKVTKLELTPNLVKMYSYGNDCILKLDKIDNKRSNYIVIDYLSTTNTYDLSDYLKTVKHTKESKQEMYDIFIQILFTLYLFQLLKLNHADLHGRNIKLEKLDKPVDLYYLIEDKLYVLKKQEYIVKIFDYDLSTTKKCGLNVVQYDSFTLKLDKFTKNLDLMKVTKVFDKHVRFNNFFNIFVKDNNKNFWRKNVSASGFIKSRSNFDKQKFVYILENQTLTIQGFIHQFVARGLLEEITDKNKIYELMKKEKVYVISSKLVNDDGNIKDNIKIKDDVYKLI